MTIVDHRWTVVLRGNFWLPHLINMLDQYRGNGEQRECADEMIAQIREQMGGEGVGKESTRPLVVIDPEDREQAERVADLFNAAYSVRGATSSAAMQAALREFANPTPPIEEPTGLGAVVEDDRGDFWVYTGMREDVYGDRRRWFHGEREAFFASINAVRVLSEGVPAEVTP